MTEEDDLGIERVVPPVRASAGPEHDLGVAGRRLLLDALEPRPRRERPAWSPATARRTPAARPPRACRPTRVRLHSAIGYITPADRLAGRGPAIWAQRDARLEAAREVRRLRRAPPGGGMTFPVPVSGSVTVNRCRHVHAEPVQSRPHAYMRDLQRVGSELPRRIMITRRRASVSTKITT